LDVVFQAGDEVPSQVRAGGTCGNVMAVLAYLGWSVKPIARLKDDAPSELIREDLARWLVNLDLVSISPDGSTPVYVQTIRYSAAQDPVHTFSSRCPTCGARLPGYKPLTASAAEKIANGIAAADVFFFDRASRGAIMLAQRCAELGALVMFEPSGVGDESLFRGAAQVSHVLKYSHERLSGEGILRECRPALQIETLGRDGLRYRSRGKSDMADDWRHLSAFPAASVRDTSGSGDWCSAGLLHCLGKQGGAGLLSATADDIEDALLFGQALGAWNCGFEGPRGGMYEVTRQAFRDQVEAILERRRAESESARSPHAGVTAATSFCPLCSPN
jgi:fructokinase